MARGLALVLFFTAACLPSLLRCESQKLIVLLVDGVRWDYLDYDGFGEDGFRRIMRTGVRAEYLQPDFPTTSYPNYYSIMTGLHCESHGMVGNYMYDIVRNQSFLIGTNPDQYNAHWWDGGDPFWITATRQGKRTYMYYWCGCEVEIRGLRPTQCQRYPNRPPTINDTRGAITDALNKLEEDKADFAGIYYELADKYGHRSGPYSSLVMGFLRDLDAQLAFLVADLDRRGLTDKVNIMIASDHGMTAISPTRTIDLTRELSPDDVLMTMDSGTPVLIWPRPGRLEQLYERLVGISEHLKVYKKEDIPERWYLKNGRLTPPLLAVADLGWTILIPKYPHFPASSATMNPLQGTHGYDNTEPDMRGIFIATGPAFRKNEVTVPLKVTDLYQVMCKIVDITPSPHNGTWDNVSGMLAETSSSVKCFSSLVVVLVVVLNVVLFS
ncbi:glycerophosphocholine cholinephosphodiesterase ENPP6-like [Haliotis rubra]|uniref:glycerophosphocholine cholinephosphodiesterase ENPP6-like n=1 Tax=Haliotis rubra TaxID=36100 RepID=UPI001EE5DB10|nr:glycerophosphocholine cholinephosphodiesterase ENPP6-like [Haliotis rubra]